MSGRNCYRCGASDANWTNSTGPLCFRCWKTWYGETSEACPRCCEARAKVRAQGYRPSAVSDHGEAFCAAYSVEIYGPATYGHPKAEVRILAALPAAAPTSPKGGR